ncbi:MAG: PfkB family carbohydrate kinase [Candidatus Liptonbacteria bacterium]|nr:PfkB family carbohydrate kinase [Candidatus Liptonbacteria bacterium]
MFDCLTIGMATRDVFVKSDAFKVLKDPAHLEKLGFPTGEAQCFALGGKIEIEKPVITVGGGAANAAVTFARQGYKTAVLVKLGDDDGGKAVLRSLKKEKIVNLSLVSADKGTAYSVILLSPEGERTILVYRGASEEMQKQEIPFRKLKAKWAYIAPGKIPFTSISLIVAHLKSQGARIAMNPSRHYIELGAKALKPILSRLDVVIMNREEASSLTGAKYEDEAKIFRKLDELVDGIAVMTDGPNGVLVSDGENIYSAGIYKEKKLVDRTGSGDAFGSGFVAGLMKAGQGLKTGTFSKEAIEYAIRLGSANATSVVEEVGAEPGILKKSEFEESSRFKSLEIAVKSA